MPALIGRNTRLEVESTLDAVKTITAITKANPGVATSTAHGYTNGDVVVLEPIAGMTELDGQIVRVANITTNTFELEGIDTTAFGTFTSGSVAKISVWATLGKARTLTAGSPGLNRLDATVLLDSEKQYDLGPSETPEITVSGLSDPTAAASLLVEKAARNGTYLGFRVTMSDNSKRIFRGQMSLPTESIPLNDLVTADFGITQRKRRLAYAT